VKTTKLILIVAAVAAVAAVAVVAPWFWIRCMDNFDVVRVGESYYKVFSYGFPIPIRECWQGVPGHTPPGQIPWRVAGNFAVFFVGGLVVAGLIRGRRGWRVRAARDPNGRDGSTRSP